MDVQQVEIVTALLALVALGGSLLLALTRLLAGPFPALGRLGADVATMSLWLAAAVALGATAGSLYFSEVAQFAPCKLCWFQRILVYPQALLLTVAAARRDQAVRVYSVPLALLGAGVSVYHYLIEWFPTWERTSCAVDVPCTAVWFRQFGFVSLSFMAAATSLSILLLHLVRFPQPSAAAKVAA